MSLLYTNHVVATHHAGELRAVALPLSQSPVIIITTIVVCSGDLNVKAGLPSMTLDISSSEFCVLQGLVECETPTQSRRCRLLFAHDELFIPRPWDLSGTKQLLALYLSFPSVFANSTHFSLSLFLFLSL